MNKVLLKSAFTVSLLLVLMAVPVYGADVNKSLSIEDGGQSDGESTVNGSITVGDKATVTGGLETVNGDIRVGDNSVIEDASTVNGSISIDDGVKSGALSTVNGSIEVGEKVTAEEISTVNGRIKLEDGSSTSGDVSTVNGGLGFLGSRVGGDVTTVNGNVDLSDGAVIAGDLIVKKPHTWFRDDSHPPKIVIGPGSRVEGTIRLERKVKLYVSESAEVGGVEGVMSMDDAVRFSGKQP
jgi:acetyltransferase-like isoleucine patch superfamily enzyme